MRALVLLNVRAGSATADSAREIGSAFARAGVDAVVVAYPPEELADAARKGAPGVDVVVAAGGDGTAAAVAAGLVGTTARMAVLPLGTMSHFAKDLAMPLGLDEAARAIAEGEERAVDVGEVNGRWFVNNSSIGVYPGVVLARERLRERRGWRKAPAMAAATLRALVKWRPMRVVVDIRDKVIPRRTSFVFVGNNRYDRSAPADALRPDLDTGNLAVYTARSPGRAALALIAVRALFGPLETARGVDVELRPEVVVSARSSLLRVALDGEVAWLETPLRYRSWKGALHVLAPPRRPSVG